jgi:membrane-bound lytic murein transglycosylase
VGRPPGYQWEPLGLDSDPVPGDPGRISEEASHLAAVAKQISSQVTELNKIANGGADGALKGAYADKIHSSAADLAGQRGKVVGRYQTVSTAQTSWIPELEQAQKMSLQALNEAEGPYTKLNRLSRCRAGTT